MLKPISVKKVRYHLVETRHISWLCRYQSWKAGIGGGFEAKVGCVVFACFFQTSKTVEIWFMKVFFGFMSSFKADLVEGASEFISTHDWLLSTFTWLQTLLDLDVFMFFINVTKRSLKIIGHHEDWSLKNSLKKTSFRSLVHLDVS